MYDWATIWQGVAGMLHWKPLLIMFIAVTASSVFAAMPGVGSSTLLAMCIPFAMTLPPYECIALMLGITVISNTANTFPSVLIAVPGGSGSQATILDGHPMAKNGEANRAFGAAYMASLLGGLFGGLVFILALPIVAPLVLLLGSPGIADARPVGPERCRHPERQHPDQGPDGRLLRPRHSPHRHRSPNRHRALHL